MTRMLWTAPAAMWHASRSEERPPSWWAPPLLTCFICCCCCCGAAEHRFCAAGRRRRRLKRLHGLHHAAPGYGAELGLFALLYAELACAQGQLDWVQLVLLHAW